MVSFKGLCNLQDVLAFLHETQGINYVCDILPGDKQWHFPVEITNKPLPEAIQYICRVFNRSMLNVNGVFVFRGMHWFDYDTSVSIESLLSEPDIKIERNQTVNPTEVEKLPARFIKASITNTSSGKAVRELSRVSLWKINVSTELERRKISLQTNFVSPAILGEAIATLFNAQTTIAIYKSNAQREEEKQLNEDKHLTEREKMSRKLRPELEKLLTEEQKQKSLSDEVSLKISSLSPSLQKKVIDYVKYLANRPNQSVNIDMGSIKDFEIVFLPPGNAPGGALGVNGQLGDGGTVGF